MQAIISIPCLDCLRTLWTGIYHHDFEPHRPSAQWLGVSEVRCQTPQVHDTLHGDPFLLCMAL